MSRFVIDYFDPSTISDGSVIVLVGKRGSGKSTVAQDLMSYQRHCKRGLCIAGTEQANPFWGQYIPECFIHHRFDEELVYQLLRDQNAIFEKYGKHEPTFAIFDDLMYDPGFLKTEAMRMLFMNGRHSKITILVAAQYMMDVPPAMRTNTDYVFIMKENSRVNRMRLYDNYPGVFDSYEDFYSVLKTCTDNYESMVLNTKSLSYNISDNTFFFKATPDLRYRMCDKPYWQYSAALKKKREEEKRRLKENDGRYEEKVLTSELLRGTERTARVEKRYPKDKTHELHRAPVVVVDDGEEEYGIGGGVYGNRFKEAKKHFPSYTERNGLKRLLAGARGENDARKKKKRRREKRLRSSSSSD
ncbi:hypothetical protein [Sicyoidochytrium minutum DNA virus]|nr:hypothetical protein [Sicyoidochytrium minutum DNA virus]